LYLRKLSTMIAVSTLIVWLLLKHRLNGNHIGGN
jgi:hypothetical protein